jgi:hypothetical protein
MVELAMGWDLTDDGKLERDEIQKQKNLQHQSKRIGQVYGFVEEQW